MAKFTGEQKLRIILESLLRDVPKKEQCQKYGISEKDFDIWNNKLLQEGGRIFEDHSSNKVRRNSNGGGLTKLIFWLSLLLNLSLLGGAASWYFLYTTPDTNEGLKKSIAQDQLNGKEGNRSGAHLALDSSSEVQPNPELDAMIATQIKNRSNLKDGEESNGDSVIDLMPAIGNVIPPIKPNEHAREIQIMGKSYEGKHVVYLLDASIHRVDSPEGKKSFAENIQSLVESISNLSSSSYFNLVLFWDLREGAALGKTILPANNENKQYAVDWLNSLEAEIGTLKENRSRFHPKELLYVKPMPGVVAGWFGLTMAISYDPDLIFVFTGKATNYQLSEIPKAHFSGLGIDLSNKPHLTNSDAVTDEGLPNFVKETAVRWLQTIESEENLPADLNKLEQVALERLGLRSDQGNISGLIDIPWQKTFEKFLINLNINFSEIPQTHFFVSLPEHMAWPSKLSETVLEFVESTNGTFSLNRNSP